MTDHTLARTSMPHNHTTVQSCYIISCVLGHARNPPVWRHQCYVDPLTAQDMRKHYTTGV